MWYFMEMYICCIFARNKQITKLKTIGFMKKQTLSRTVYSVLKSFFYESQCIIYNSYKR